MSSGRGTRQLQPLGAPRCLCHPAQGPHGANGNGVRCRYCRYWVRNAAVGAPPTTLVHDVATPSDVDRVLAEARAAGATVAAGGAARGLGWRRRSARSSVGARAADDGSTMGDTARYRAPCLTTGLRDSVHSALERGHE